MMNKSRLLLKICFLVLLGSFIISCTNKSDPVIPDPASELIAYSGKNRVKIEFSTPGNAEYGKVFYGNGNFDLFTIGNSDDRQSVIVDGLPEEEQIIRVATFSADSITSEPRGVKVNVYGEKYQNSLKNRNLISQSNLSPTSIRMDFDDSMEDEVEVRILFVTINGRNDSIILNNNQNSIIIDEIDLSKSYYYYTVYLPEMNCLDEFYTPRQDAREAAMRNFSKENWLIADFSDESPGMDGNWGVASNIIDNDASTSWYSMKETGPHWITVDMQSEKIIEGFYFVQTQNLDFTDLAKQFKFETSSDNQNWTIIEEGEFANDRLRQSFSFSDQVVARYFRITILDGYEGAGKTQIAEIDLFNEVNVSGENGPRAIPLVNAVIPFEGDGSDLFPAVGAGRMQKVAGWVHSENAYISYDNGAFVVWSAAVWGIPDVTNGKIYQSIDLEPGNYTLSIDAGHTSNILAADVLGIVAMGSGLPDYSDVANASEVLSYRDLVMHKESINSLKFSLDSPATITIGIVYNTHNIYDSTGIPWSDFYINGFSLALNL